jgi:hypothetical protein
MTSSPSLKQVFIVISIASEPPQVIMTSLESILILYDLQFKNPINELLVYRLDVYPHYELNHLSS